MTLKKDIRTLKGKEIKEKYCEKHKEFFKYNPFGYFCISCYNQNLIKIRQEGLIK